MLISENYFVFLQQILKSNVMATYQIKVNEKKALGKSIIAFLHTVPQVVTIDKSKVKAEKKSWLYYELESAFADVRLMMDGKKKEKTAQEFLEEMRNGK